MLQVFEDALRMYRGWFDEHNDNGGDDTSVKPFADLDPVELQVCHCIRVLFLSGKVLDSSKCVA